MYKKVVLAVDDDPEMLALLNLMLRRKGYVVLKADSAGLALHLIKSFLPNLFVVDVLMPDMNGFELCERIRMMPHTANVPIIILTALNSTENRQRANDVGANAFIAKENLTSDLASEIQRLLYSDTRQSDRKFG
jgi:two-component system sensor histidine kinase ChiS